MGGGGIRDLCLLGGSGGMPSQKILVFTFAKIDSKAIVDSNLCLHNYIIFS